MLIIILYDLYCPFIFQIREIGLQYYNCADNLLAKDIVARLEARRHTAMIRHLAKNRECADLLNETRPTTYIERVKESFASVSIQQWNNNTCCSNVATNKCPLCKTRAINLLEKEICVAVSKKLDGVCKSADVFTTPVTIGQQVYSHNNYVTMRLREEYELKR